MAGLSSAADFDTGFVTRTIFPLPSPGLGTWQCHSLQLSILCQGGTVGPRRVQTPSPLPELSAALTHSLCSGRTHPRVTGLYSLQMRHSSVPAKTPATLCSSGAAVTRIPLCQRPGCPSCPWAVLNTKLNRVCLVLPKFEWAISEQLAMSSEDTAKPSSFDFFKTCGPGDGVQPHPFCSCNGQSSCRVWECSCGISPLEQLSLSTALTHFSLFGAVLFSPA